MIEDGVLIGGGEHVLMSGSDGWIGSDFGWVDVGWIESPSGFTRMVKWVGWI